MNTKQAMRILSSRIDAIEQQITVLIDRMREDIRDYNSVIDSMIKGEGPCPWCEDYQECQLDEKGKGCEEWMLRWPNKREESADDGKGILQECTDRGERIEGA